jgi:predicted membrane protein
MWLLMAVPAAIFTFVQFTQFGTARIALQMIAMALFVGLSVIHAAGFEVSSVSTTAIFNAGGQQVGTNVEEIILIAGGETYSWISYIFAALSIFNIFSLFQDKLFNFKAGGM